MPLLLGRYVNKVDRKGRVSVPKLFRESFKGQESGFSGVYAYPVFNFPAVEACGEDFMTRVVDSLEDMAMFSEDQDDLSSVLTESTVPLPFDPEGRVVLPDELIEHAGIDGEAMFVGRGKAFRIWNPETYRQHRQAAFERARARGATLSLRREREESR
jgi:MraZ protein